MVLPRVMKLICLIFAFCFNASAQMVEIHRPQFSSKTESKQTKQVVGGECSVATKKESKKASCDGVKIATPKKQKNQSLDVAKEKSSTDSKTQ